MGEADKSKKCSFHPIPSWSCSFPSLSASCCTAVRDVGADHVDDHYVPDQCTGPDHTAIQHFIDTNGHSNCHGPGTDLFAELQLYQSEAELTTEPAIAKV